MTDIERRQMSAGIVLLVPVMAWLVVAKKTENIPSNHKLLGFYHAALNTPHRPYLIAALGLGLIVGIGIAWLINSLGRTEFAGAPFRKFLRGTRIVSADRLKRETRDKKDRKSASSPTAPPSFASSARSCSNRTTSGPSRDATSQWKASRKYAMKTMARH